MTKIMISPREVWLQDEELKAEVQRIMEAKPVMNLTEDEVIATLRQHFPTTLNDELAGMLGVSKSALARKARELELKKDPDWLHAVYEERRIMAHVVAKRLGYRGRIQKGEHRSPATEFKKLSTEFNSLNTSDNEK